MLFVLDNGIGINFYSLAGKTGWINQLFVHEEVELLYYLKSVVFLKCSNRVNQRNTTNESEMIILT